MINIIRFELRYLLKRPATWVYFVLLFSLSFLYESTDAVTLGGGVGKIMRNAPYVLAQATVLLTLIGSIITTALAGSAVLRDIEFGVHSLFYTKPISKAQYLFGRFIGAYVMMLFVYASIPIGLLLGSVMPWVEADKMGPMLLTSYLLPFVLFVVPNIFVISSIFFTVGTLSRNMFAVYVQGIVLVFAYALSGTIVGGLENTHLAAVLDMFGLRGFALETRYWTVFEKNSLSVPLGTFLLLNRGVWLAVGASLLLVCYRLFKFDVQGSHRKTPARNDDETVGEAGAQLRIPQVTQEFGFAYRWRSFYRLSMTAIRSITGDVLFLALASIGVINTLVELYFSDRIFDTPVFPVTYMMLETLGGFIVFVLLISTFYGGELIWRERRYRAHQIVDSLALPGWTTFASKVVALIVAQMIVIAALNCAAMIMQLAKGYTAIEFGLYLREYFVDSLITVSLLSLFTLSIHSIVNNKYIGHLVAVALYIVSLVLPALKVEHIMFQFMNTASGMYSDMNAYGPYTPRHLVTSLYWLSFFTILAWIGFLLYARGTEEGIAERVRQARRRLSSKALSFAAVVLLIFIGSGSWIYYNTNVLNRYASGTDQRHQQAKYERSYRSFVYKAQPHIVATSIRVDLEPERLRYSAQGTFVLRNNTQSSIDTVLVNLNDDKHYDMIRFNRPARLIRDDSVVGVRLYVLEPALLPQDSCEMNFNMHCAVEGFRSSTMPTDIAYNGTFIHSDVFPQLGYQAEAEISDESERKKEGLSTRERMLSIDDPRGLSRNYLSANADWMRFEMTISTAPDQIAVAPGYLQREWSENGRRVFRYMMDAPILNFYSLLSARYEVKRDSVNGIALEVYYHKGHEFNVDRMIGSMKKSLNYFATNFAAFQYRQMRILEFPRYQSFAQSFPNTVPYSESIGFIARIKSEEDIDYPFYVTAHEVAHQWWGHQVVGAAVQGATMLSESFAEYSALMVMKHEYGEATMKKFLKFALNSYLRGRSTERSKEQPLYLNENQQYLHYNKGSLVLYALADYIGEDSLNAALSRFCKNYRFQAAPYATSKNFLAELRRVVPDSLQYLVEDNFETITLYDNRIKNAKYKEVSPGSYSVTFSVESRKLRADSLGREHEIPLHDYVDIGIFDEHEDPRTKLGKALLLKRVKLDNASREFQFQISGKPAKAGIDPMNKLIDRDAEDNVMTVEAP